MGCISCVRDQKSLQYAFTQKDLHLQRRRWLDILRDYLMSFFYHHDKVNLVLDAPCKMYMVSVSYIQYDKNMLVSDVHRSALLGFQLVDSTKNGVTVHNSSE